MSEKIVQWIHARGCQSGVMLFLVCICFQAVAADQDQVQKMQQVIDRQQKQLDVQQDELEAQQSQLDQQSQLLEKMQKQLNALAGEPKSEAAGITFSKVAPTPAIAQSDKPTTDAAVTQFDPTAQKPTSGHAFGRNEGSHPSFHMNYDFNELDRFPTDIDDDKGMFIASDDGKKLFRLYGSLRTRAMWENRNNVQPWNLDMPEIPTGEDDTRRAKFVFSSLESRIGLDLSVRDLLSMRGEFDLRGTDGPLRIRHLYIRNKRWVVGKNWTAFNTINFLPIALDYHSSGVAVGSRTTQIKYTGGSNNWFYQVALEDHQPTIIAPDDVEANAQNTIPNMVGHIERRKSWGQWRVAGLLAPNRVRYTGGTQNVLGWGLMAGIKIHLNESNLLKAHVLSITGQNTMIADFSVSGEYDMIYDPGTNNFDNMRTVGGQVGLEHNWTPVLSSTFAAGYVNMHLKSYQDPEFFNSGYKALVNLIWRPAGYLDGLWMGVELEQVGRNNLDHSKNTTNRVNFILWYDF